jgi:hypothetical protein
MSDYVFEETVIDALCIWEEIITESMNSNHRLYERICDDQGVYHGRSNAVLLAPFVNQAWQECQEICDTVFDWEFIPLALPVFAQMKFDAALEFSDFLIKEIVAKIRQEARKEEEQPQMALDL